MKFTEAQLEQAFIDLLGNEGIQHHLGQTIQRSPEEVLIKDDLKTFLLQQYQKKKSQLQRWKVSSAIWRNSRLPICTKATRPL